MQVCVEYVYLKKLLQAPVHLRIGSYALSFVSLHNSVYKNADSFKILGLSLLCVQALPTHIRKPSFAYGRSGTGCSKLTTSFVNETLKFQTLIFQIFQ